MEFHCHVFGAFDLEYREGGGVECQGGVRGVGYNYQIICLCEFYELFKKFGRCVRASGIVWIVYNYDFRAL